MQKGGVIPIILALLIPHLISVLRSAALAKLKDRISSSIYDKVMKQYNYLIYIDILKIHKYLLIKYKTDDDPIKYYNVILGQANLIINQNDIYIKQEGNILFKKSELLDIFNTNISYQKFIKYNYNGINYNDKNTNKFIYYLIKNDFSDMNMTIDLLISTDYLFYLTIIDENNNITTRKFTYNNLKENLDRINLLISSSYEIIKETKYYYNIIFSYYLDFFYDKISNNFILTHDKDKDKLLLNSIIISADTIENLYNYDSILSGVLNFTSSLFAKNTEYFGNKLKKFMSVINSIQSTLSLKRPIRNKINNVKGGGFSFFSSKPKKNAPTTSTLTTSKPNTSTLTTSKPNTSTTKINSPTASKPTTSTPKINGPLLNTKKSKKKSSYIPSFFGKNKTIPNNPSKNNEINAEETFENIYNEKNPDIRNLRTKILKYILINNFKAIEVIFDLEDGLIELKFDNSFKISIDDINDFYNTFNKPIDKKLRYTQKILSSGINIKKITKSSISKNVIIECIKDHGIKIGDNLYIENTKCNPSINNIYGDNFKIIDNTKIKLYIKIIGNCNSVISGILYTLNKEIFEAYMCEKRMNDMIKNSNQHFLSDLLYNIKFKNIISSIEISKNNLSINRFIKNNIINKKAIINELIDHKKIDNLFKLEIYFYKKSSNIEKNIQKNKIFEINDKYFFIVDYYYNYQYLLNKKAVTFGLYKYGFKNKIFMNVSVKKYIDFINKNIKDIINKFITEFRILLNKDENINNFIMSLLKNDDYSNIKLNINLENTELIIYDTKNKKNIIYSLFDIIKIFKFNDNDNILYNIKNKDKFSKLFIELSELNNLSKRYEIINNFLENKKPIKLIISDDIIKLDLLKYNKKLNINQVDNFEFNINIYNRNLYLFIKNIKNINIVIYSKNKKIYLSFKSKQNDKYLFYSTKNKNIVNFDIEFDLLCTIITFNKTFNLHQIYYLIDYDEINNILNVNNNDRYSNIYKKIIKLQDQKLYFIDINNIIKLDKSYKDIEFDLNILCIYLCEFLKFNKINKSKFKIYINAKDNEIFLNIEPIIPHIKKELKNKVISYIPKKIYFEAIKEHFIMELSKLNEILNYKIFTLTHIKNEDFAIYLPGNMKNHTKKINIKNNNSFELISSILDKN